MHKTDSGFGVVEIVLAVIVIALVGTIGWTTYQHQQNNTVTTPKVIEKKSVTNEGTIPPYVANSDYASGVKFDAMITSDGCANSSAPAGDVGCSLTLNSVYKVNVKHGNASQSHPWGSLINFPTDKDSTGSRVEVYAHQLDKSTYTLEGSTDYHVKIISVY